jgi:predicted DCC family thiol-disulfide oxidoreductase YuxK
VRDFGYGLVVGARYRLFGRYDACPLPPPQHRDRFLDVPL